MQQKKCSKCSQEKPFTEFNRRRKAKDGRRSSCRDCQSKDGVKYYSQNHEARKAYDRLYNEKNKAEKKRYRDNYKKQFPDKVKNSMAKATKKYIGKNPDKLKAYLKVYRAKKSGLLEKEPCGNCGSTADVMAHHEDYSKPLSVDWLCRTCHILVHKKLPKHHALTAGC